LVVACTSVIYTYGVVARSLTCVSFLLAIACTSGLVLKLISYNVYSKRIIMIVGFFIEIAYFIAIWIVGDQIYEDFDSSVILTKWQIILLSCITGASMGVHNAVAKEAIPNCPSTTVMTMTLVTVGQLFAQTFEYFLASKKLFNLRPCILSNCSNIEMDEATTTAYYNSMQTKYNDSLSKLIVAFKPLFAFVAGALVGSGATDAGKFTSLIIPIFFTFVICIDSLIKVYVDDKATKTPTYSSVTEEKKTDIEMEGKKEATNKI